MKLKEIFKITWFPVLIASFCHLSPIILVLFGLSSVAFASSLDNTLCGEYMWAFRIMGAIFLVVSLIHYFRKKGIKTCNINRQNFNQVINLTLIVLFSAVLSYIFFLYVILGYLSVKLGLPNGHSIF